MKSLQHLFFDEQTETFSKFFLLSLLGPLCLLLGLFSLLLKYAQPLWPISAAAFLGFIFTWKWKKSGFALSFLLLGCALWGVYQSQGLLWPSLLSSSIALSWLLLLLGHQEMLLKIREREETMAVLKENNAALLCDLERIEKLASRDQNEMAAAIEHLKSQIPILQAQLSSLQSQIEKEEKEKENWKNKHEELSVEVSSYQRKEKAFQHALEDAQNQFLKWKYETAKEAEKPAPTILPQEEDLTEEKSYQMLQTQHVQLKEQFEEKSEVLHQTRRELFLLESQFLTQQKQTEESACSFSGDDAAYMDYIQRMQEDYLDLESQVLALQEFVSVLLQPKKSAAPRKRKTTKGAQEDLFLMMQDKVDEAQSFSRSN